MGIAAALITPLWLPLPAESITMPPLKEWLGILWPLPVGIALVATGRLLLRLINVVAPPAGDLWWIYASVTAAGLAPVKRINYWCSELKTACVISCWKVERTLMDALTRMLKAENWMRHHASGLMMALAVLLAALLIWEGQR